MKKKERRRKGGERNGTGERRKSNRKIRIRGGRSEKWKEWGLIKKYRKRR